jgi:hypothetical protein
MRLFKCRAAAAAASIGTITDGSIECSCLKHEDMAVLFIACMSGHHHECVCCGHDPFNVTKPESVFCSSRSTVRLQFLF